MVWRRHQDQLKQHSVIDLQSTHAIAPSVNIPHYDLMGPDDSTDSELKRVHLPNIHLVEIRNINVHSQRGM